MMKLTRLFGVLALGLSLVSAPALAEPASKPAAAESFLKKKQTAVMQVLKKPATDARSEKLTTMLKEFLDYGDIAEQSLSKEWGKRSVKERAEFVSLLRQLVERQYQKNLETTLDFAVKYTGAEAVDDGVLVKTSARSKKKRRSPAVEIDYNMKPNGDAWRVTDISTDGVSLVKNYKRQFRRIIRKEQWTGLIARMQKRLKSDGEDF